MGSFFYTYFVYHDGHILGGGRGRSGTMVGRLPGCFFRVLRKRIIPKPDQHRKDIIQQELLGTDIFIRTEEQQLHIGLVVVG